MLKQLFLCISIFLCVVFFTFCTPVYRCFVVLSSIFPLHNCIQVSHYLKYILKITIFRVVEKPLFPCVFIPNGFPYIFFKEKNRWRFVVIFYIFLHKILIFWLFFYFIVLYLSYIFNTDTCWERKMLSGLICSRRNRDVNKQRRLLHFPEFLWP